MTRGNRVSASSDFICALICALAASALFAPSAYAYVDPSVMTYTIQALAGVAVALSAVAGVAFRRTRKTLFKVLKIDENANKIVDPEWHQVEGGSDERVLQPEFERAEHLRVHGKPKSYKVRLAQAVLSVAFVMFTVFIVAPVELIAFNSKWLTFSIGDIIGPLLLMSLGVVAIASPLIALLRGRAFSVACAIVVALGICAYAQAMFMNMGLPAADGFAIDWSKFIVNTALSSLAWIAIIVVFVLLALFKSRLATIISTVACVALMLVQGIAIISILVNPPSTSIFIGKDTPVITETGLYTVSPKENVIVFVLDTFDTWELNEILSQEPNILDEMTGFTYYRDSVGSMIPTRYAVPFLLTDSYPEPGQDVNDYLNSRWDHTEFVDALNNKGYSVGIYSDSAEDTNGTLATRSINTHPVDPVERAKDIDPLGAVQILSQSALYRDAPWLFKRYFWYYTDELNNWVYGRMSGNAGNLNFDQTPYTVNDLFYYTDLMAVGLSATDEGETGAYRFIHLAGTHQPYTITKEIEKSDSSGTTDIEQGIANLKMVSEYLRQLKKLGVYDNSTIIITADHGAWYWTMTPIQSPTSPIMLVKQRGGTEQSSEHFKTSSAPVSHFDVIPTLLEAIGADYASYGPTGMPMKSIEPGIKRDRRYIMTTHDGADHEWLEYVIDGYAMLFRNWHLTGNTWDVEPSWK